LSLPSGVPNMREILRGMSIASDTHDEFMTADDYYEQPQHYVDGATRHRSSHPLLKVGLFIIRRSRRAAFE